MSEPCALCGLVGAHTHSPHATQLAGQTEGGRVINLTLGGCLACGDPAAVAGEPCPAFLARPALEEVAVAET